MLVNLFSVVGKDKYIEHPKLGGISCTGLHEAFKRCKQLMKGSSNDSLKCNSFYQLSYGCFSSQNPEEFRRFIDNELEERRKLNQFLKERESILPELQSKNVIYDILINENASDPRHDITSKRVSEYLSNEGRENRKYFEEE